MPHTVDPDLTEVFVKIYIEPTQTTRCCLETARPNGDRHEAVNAR